VFRHEGPSRDVRTNGIIAGYLAFVAGFVNSGGFVLIHSYTSHVTGSVGRFGHDLAMGELAAAFSAIFLVLSFFAGAFAATLLTEGSPPERIAVGYAVALAVQGGVLATFILVAGVSSSQHPRVHDAQAAILCIALGMQNSLVTRLSGAVVRTTHLTGVVTDLAIEAARWYRFHHAKLKLPTLLAGRMPPERPRAAQALLLGVIVAAFVIGTTAGALLTLRTSRWAMALPAFLVFALAGYAYSQRNIAASIPPPARSP
jgi:uncharacterized membrane protein YoaK (UPF0700 family)